MQGVAVFLYDYTGTAARPWAQAGYTCICYDIQHNAVAPRVEDFASGGRVLFVHADLHDRRTLSGIVQAWRGQAVFMGAFPVCTDMAVSGAAHFEAKAEANPLFQDEAADHAIWCGRVGDALGVPYFVENPVSVLSSLWRKPDHTFDPWQYGGYIPAHEAAHPVWPDYIAPFDAYPKKTCLWTGGGYIMPAQKPVAVEAGYSRQHKRLGGKSDKTKNIRSATPRGFSIANFEANAPHIRHLRPVSNSQGDLFAARASA